jgi:hypothetical protein
MPNQELERGSLTEGQVNGKMFIGEAYKLFPNERLRNQIERADECDKIAFFKFLNDTTTRQGKKLTE